MASRTIHLQGERRVKEYAAAGTIKPGHLIVVGSAGTVTAHGTAGGAGRVLFAQEDALQGRSVDTSYTSGERVTAHSYASGEVVNAILKAGTNYTPDIALVSAGDGTLQPLTALPSAARPTAKIIGYVKTALDLSAGGAVNTLNPVEIA